jgi:predicted permease
MNILEIIISVLLPILFGYFFKFIKIFSDYDAVILRRFIVKASVPFIIFKNLYTADISLFSQIVPTFLAFVIVSILFTLISQFISKFISKDKHEKRAFSIATQFGNYGYLGWGIMFYFFGDGGFTRAVFFSMFFWPVFLILGFLMIYLENRENFSFREFLKALAANALIPIASALLGLIFNIYKVNIHPVLKDFIFTFSSFTIPMILFTIGLNLNFKLPVNKIKIALFSSSIRLIFGIFLGLIASFIISLFFKIDDLSLKVILLETVMPSATMAAFFADFIDMDKELLAAILTISTLLSLVTLPLWFYLVETNWFLINVVPIFVR